MPFTSTTIRTDPYTPNGVTTIFPFFFPALSADELQVVLTDADGIETVLTNGFDVRGIGEASGGYVEFIIPPIFDGRTLTIRATPSFTQETDFENQGAYLPSEVNKALDRLAQKDLYLRDLILRLAAGGVVSNPGGGATGPVDWSAIQNKPTTFAPAAHVHAGEDITTGLVAAARIASLDAGKITTGTFAAARIPSLDAGKITSGVLDPARIPPTPSGVVAPTNIASLTAPQQATIVEGTLVTTSDGQRWVYSGTGSKVLEASYVNIGSSTPSWSAVTGKPAELVSLAALSITADTLPYGSGVDTFSLTPFTATGRALAGMASQNAAIAYTSPLTTKGDLYGYGAAPGRLPVGTNGQVLTADSTQTLGVKWATPASGGSGGSNMPLFTTIFSGNGDGTTNNDAAFTAAEGSAYDYIWLPEGLYKTTLPITSLNKTYLGPGKIWRGAGNGAYANTARYAVDVHPTRDPLIEYGVAEDLRFSRAQYKTVKAGTRRNFDRYLQQGGSNGYPLYFWAPSTPEFMNFKNDGGWSGFSGATSGPITAGVTTSVGIVGGTTGWNTGDVIGFTNAMDGNVTETRTITVSGGSISWSGPLTNSYPTGSVITHGYRTMQAAYLTVAEHRGLGDCYVHCGIMTMTGDGLLPSQTAFENRKTGGLFGGSLAAAGTGTYGTGWECQYQDNNYDTGMIGRIDSYIRLNNAGGYGNMWLHDIAKMDGGGTDFATYGLKRIDGVYVAAVGAHTGLDFTRSTFDVAAVALPLGQKVSFDAQIVAPGPTNGNGWVATTDGGMYLYGTTISGVKTLELQNNGYRMRLQASGAITTNAGITTAQGILAGLAIQSNTALCVGDTTTGLFLEGGVLKIKKGGVVVASY